MNHTAHGQTNASARQISPPAAASRRQPSHLRRIPNQMFEMAKSARFVVLSLSAVTILMLVGYLVGGTPSLWDTFIGGLFALTHLGGRNKRRPQNRRNRHQRRR